MNGYDFGGKMDPKEREHYANHPWNLNNLPILKDSVLSHMETGISGVFHFSDLKAMLNCHFFSKNTPIV